MISVIMPTFNQGKFIDSAIQSILAQTYEDWELIIVDDGSTDKTPEKIRSYVMMYDKIKSFRIENSGTGTALNVGFAAAQGNYQTWFASDNLLYPQAFEKLSRYLDNHLDIDYVYGNIEIGIMDATGLVEKERHNIEREILQKWNPNTLFEHYNLGIVWLWRRWLKEKAGLFQKEPCEDYDMVLRMVEAGGRFAYLPETLGWFRRHNENVTRKIALMGDKDRYSKYVQEKARKRRGMQ
jgi:glycosyltransferase involved in cell wall biosynthesis